MLDRSRVLLISCLLAIAAGHVAFAQAPLRLLRITPAGEDVPPERQIVFQFDRPVVPLGRMQRTAAEVPITIEPDPRCEWRWIDRSALACQLGERNPLLPATRYTITVRPELTAEDGAHLAEPVIHTLTTKRPAVEGASFESWPSPSTPVILVIVNQEVTLESLRAKLSFRMEGHAPIAVEAQRFDEEGEEEGERLPTAWTVKPEHELPLDSVVALHVEPGLRPVRGSEPGIENRDIVNFRTFPPPRFLGIRCWSIRDETLRRNSEEPHASQAIACNPLQSVQLLFSSPVGEEVLRDHLQVEPAHPGGREAWGEPTSRLNWMVENHEYPVGLPGPLLAAQEYHLRAAAEEIEDQFGRPLVAPIDFRFATDHRKPDLGLTHPVSVLESQVETHLPVVSTNLQAIRAQFDRLTARGASAGLVEELSFPSVPDIAFRHPLRVRDWLDAGSGAVVGSLTSEPSTGPPQWFFSEVTPFHVHVKVGHYNTLVWVTDLETGAPVQGAVVEIVEQRLDTFREQAKERGEAARTDGDGIALLPGAEQIDPTSELITYWRDREKPHLLVLVKAGDALAVVPLIREFRADERGPNQSWIANWRQRRHGHIRAWGVTAQGIYRAGDTVQFKVWVRNEGNETLVAAPPKAYALKVIDPLDKVVHERGGIELNAFGTFDGEFKVPETGAVGWYRFELRADFAPEQVWEPVTVLISDFTPAPFRVTTDLDGELFLADQTVTATTRAALHAGGPYGSAETRVTAIVRPRSLAPAAEAAKGFFFEVGPAESETIHRTEAALDDGGLRVTTFETRAEKVLYGELVVESAVRDDRGKYVAGHATARYAGRDRYVGVRQGDWVLRSGEPTTFAAVVTDELGQLAPGTEVRFTVEKLKTQAARVKGAGNAYLTQYVQSWESLGGCVEVSASEPVTCAFTPTEPGEYRLGAAIEDTAGRPVSSQLYRWAVGRGVVLWEESPGHHLQIVPEKDNLHVGDTARYLIKNPFPGARALVTIERAGVIKRWFTTLDDSTAMLEFPIEPDYLPGFYLSVVVTSPRVERPPGDGDDVDLGKPAFRMGYVRTEVRDAYKELDVRVKPAQELLKPRETATVEIEARTRQGDVPEMEFAVAVLDEAVLDLLVRGSAGFDPYRGLYELGALDLWNFNLLKNLIGIQKFEKKGATPGGDGGLDPALRSVFKFVSYWNPALRADREGRARIEFVLPDNLTAWRVLVMAATAGDRLGFGQASFRVNRPTEIRPALPNQVVEGDRFTARFTVMNRTDRPRKLTVKAEAQGSVRGRPSLRSVIEAEPFRRHTLGLDVQTAGPGTVRLAVRAGDSEDQDALAPEVPVRRRLAFETAAEYGSTTDVLVTEELQFPSEMREDVGQLTVAAAPTVIGSLEGAFRYMRDYPYLCWEQILSKGVMAAHYRALHDWLPRDLTWPEAERLPQETLDLAANFQAPNGGMTFFVPTDEYASPYLSAYTALAFQWLRERGHTVAPGVEQRLQAYLQEFLRRDAFPTFYSKGMAASVRAVALAALARTGKLAPGDLERYRSHVPQMDLFGRAHYLQALNRTPGTDAARREVRESILAHASESAGKIAFTEQLDDGYVRLLHSELRTSCAILEALVAEGPAALGAAGVAELPFKLVRSVTQTRKSRDHWENTQENLFCTAALVAYAEAYERETPSLTVTASLDKERLGRATFQDRRAGTVEIERPIREGDAGRRAQVRLEREGTGRLYYAVRLSYAPTDAGASETNAGIEVHREYSVEREERWVRLEDPARVRQGELVRVDLYVVLPAPRSFVVVDDPLPGGLEPVNRDLATASTVDAGKAADSLPPDSFYHRFDDWQWFSATFWSFYHRELRHDRARFYSEYLSAGRYHLSYVAQVIAPGKFAALPTHAEEMYDPDVFGRGALGTLEVERVIEKD